MSLEKVRAPVLEDAICFQVDNMGETDPSEAGPLIVNADTERISIHFSGCSKERWEGTWTELRWLLRRLRDERLTERITKRRKLDADKLLTERAEWTSRKKPKP
jgi:hypothetical protein